jgi:hypothetical protein
MRITGGRSLGVLIVCVVAGASALTSCAVTTTGSGSKSPAFGPTSSAATSPSAAPSSTAATPTPSATGTPATAAHLATLVLQTGDVPTTWTAATDTPDPDASAEQASLTSCVGARDTTADMVAQSNSDDFTMGDAEISSQASSYKSTDDITTDVGILTNPKIDSCYEALAKSQIAAGPTVDSVTIAVTPGAAGGPSNVVATLTGTITITESGQMQTLYLNSAFITGPLIEAEVDFDSPDAAVPAVLQAQLVALVANRVAAG